MADRDPVLVTACCGSTTTGASSCLLTADPRIARYPVNVIRGCDEVGVRRVRRPADAKPAGAYAVLLSPLAGSGSSSPRWRRSVSQRDEHEPGSDRRRSEPRTLLIQVGHSGLAGSPLWGGGSTLMPDDIAPIRQNLLVSHDPPLPCGKAVTSDLPHRGDDREFPNPRRCGAQPLTQITGVTLATLRARPARWAQSTTAETFL